MDDFQVDIVAVMLIKSDNRIEIVYFFLESEVVLFFFKGD